MASPTAALLCSRGLCEAGDPRQHHRREPQRFSDAGVEIAGEFFGIGALIVWIGTFKLLVFNPKPRPWKKLAWWTLIAIVVPGVAVLVNGKL